VDILTAPPSIAEVHAGQCCLRAFVPLNSVRVHTIFFTENCPASPAKAKPGSAFVWQEAINGVLHGLAGRGSLQFMPGPMDSLSILQTATTFTNQTQRIGLPWFLPTEPVCDGIRDSGCISLGRGLFWADGKYKTELKLSKTVHKPDGVRPHWRIQASVISAPEETLFGSPRCPVQGRK